MTTPTPIATAADYADALLTARRAKNILFWSLLTMLLLQLLIFFLARYTDAVLPAAAAATQPVGRTLVSLLLEYLTGLTVFLGIALTVVLAVVLLLILQVMVMGRLIGVSHLTSAFLACVLLTVLLFPWQAFLNYSDLHGADFRLPGVLYTWSELAQSARFSDLPAAATLLKWWRFVGFPLVAIFFLLRVQSRSRRGLRQALGDGAAPLAPDTVPLA